MSAPRVSPDQEVYFGREIARTQWAEIAALLQGDYKFVIGSTGAPAIEASVGHGMFGLEKALFGMDTNSLPAQDPSMGTLAQETDHFVEHIREYARHIAILKDKFESGNIPKVTDTSGSAVEATLYESVEDFLNYTGLEDFLDEVYAATTNAQVVQAYSNTVSPASSFARFGFGKLEEIYDALVPTANLSGVVTSDEKVTFAASTQDIINLEYSRAGEDNLNRVVGALGERLETVNEYIRNLNTIDEVMSSSDLNVDFEGGLVFDAAGVFRIEDKVDGMLEATNNLVQMAKDGKLEELQLEAVEDIVNSMLQLYGLPVFNDPVFGGHSVIDTFRNTTSGGGGIDQGEADGGFVAGTNIIDITNMPNFADSDGLKAHYIAYMNQFNGGTQYQSLTQGSLNISATSAADTTLRLAIQEWFKDTNIITDVTQALTAAQELNTIGQQRLRRSIFVYQEFVESASLVMDRMNEMITNMSKKFVS